MPSNITGAAGAIVPRASVIFAAPVDGDSLAASTVRTGMQSLADHLDFMMDRAGLLSEVQTWAAAQTFTAAAQFNNNLTVALDLQVNGNTYLGNGAGDQTTFSGPAVVTGLLQALAAVTVGTTLNVTGATTLAGLGAGATTLASLGVTGAATVGTTLLVTGLSTLTGGGYASNAAASFIGFYGIALGGVNGIGVKGYTSGAGGYGVIGVGDHASAYGVVAQNVGGGVALLVSTGDAKFTGTNPALGTGASDMLTRTNIIKMWGSYKVGSGLQDGFNVNIGLAATATTIYFDLTTDLATFVDSEPGVHGAVFVSISRTDCIAKASFSSEGRVAVGFYTLDGAATSVLLADLTDTFVSIMVLGRM